MITFLVVIFLIWFVFRGTFEDASGCLSTIFAVIILGLIINHYLT